MSSFGINLLLTESAMSEQLVNAQLRLWFPFYQNTSRNTKKSWKILTSGSHLSQVSDNHKLPNYADLLTASNREPRAFLKSFSMSFIYSNVTQKRSVRLVAKGEAWAVPTCVGTGAKHHISEDTRLWTNILTSLPDAKASEETWIVHKVIEKMPDETKDWMRESGNDRKGERPEKGLSVVKLNDWQSVRHRRPYAFLQALHMYRNKVLFD